MKKSFSFCALLGMLLPLSACEKPINVNNSTIQNLDLNRYLGSWYEIARYDHVFERGQNNCTAYYSMKNDGTIRVENRGWKNGKQKTSIGKAVTTAVPGLMRVSFAEPFYGDYRVLMIDKDYTVALIGGSNDKYLWILSRTPELTEITKQAVLNEAQRRQYDTGKLIWVDQRLNIK